MTNRDALDHWSGEAGDHWASEAERYDGMNRQTAEKIIGAASPQPGERILDVGCGNGALALGIAPMVAPKDEAGRRRRLAGALYDRSDDDHEHERPAAL
jgi:hypothetical protein